MPLIVFVFHPALLRSQQPHQSEHLLRLIQQKKVSKKEELLQLMTFGAGNCSCCVYSVSAAAALVHVRQLGGSCPVLKSFVILHRRHLRRVKSCSVLSDDGSSGSDSTIRALRLRTRTTLKVVRSRSASEKANRSNISIRFHMELDQLRPIHLIKWIRRHHRTPLQFRIRRMRSKMTSSIKDIPSPPCMDCWKRWKATQPSTGGLEQDRVNKEMCKTSPKYAAYQALLSLL
ncbi:hypothetical protein EVAR_90266_1 [Eumeta japonica]|uniref:Uncharacterized protein n=1 Tax=Eumeta variegata TaxID=151549 RepID=A0A4C2ADH0_EUMVA|nr:hypothetical protein EVAR_90266_1 [Eumeta japonica]